MSNSQTPLSPISAFPLFDCLDPAEKTMLESMVECKVKQKYSFIYLPDEPSDTIFFLARGSVKTATHSADGKEVIKSIFHPLAMFGELGIVGEAARTDLAQCLREEVHLYLLSVDDMKLLMQRNFALCDRVLSLFGSRLIQAENKLESLIFKDARSRIIDFIKEAIARDGTKVGYEMLLRHSLTHQDIANITCTSRQTVTLVLNELKKSDLIYFNRGKILVRDMEKLS